ncbi:MAG: hypothetical protein LBS60_01795 [Deltaproteobacteria bacterium]|nr:hypothetical protein [Deltaproteobacteria bacterium]
MKLNLILGLILVLFVGLGWAISPAVWAQSSPAQPPVAIIEEDLPLWFGGRLFPDSSTVSFTFILDIKGLKNKTFKSLDKLTVTSDKGEIVFNGPFDLAKSSNFIFGRLTLTHDLRTVLINQAVGVIDGQSYDLTGHIRAVNYQDITVFKSSPEYLACPNKVLDFAIYEGVFTGIEEGDYLHANIDMKGKVDSFLVDNEVADFFSDEKNYNKKVKIFVEKLRALDDYDSNECLDSERITKYILLSPAIKGK